MYGPGGDDARNPSAMNVGRKTMARAVTTAVGIRMARAHASGVLSAAVRGAAGIAAFSRESAQPPYRFSCVLTRPVISCNRAQVSGTGTCGATASPTARTPLSPDSIAHRVRQRLPDRAHDGGRSALPQSAGHHLHALQARAGCVAVRAVPCAERRTFRSASVRPAPPPGAIGDHQEREKARRHAGTAPLVE